MSSSHENGNLEYDEPNCKRSNASLDKGIELGETKPRCMPLDENNAMYQLIMSDFFNIEMLLYYLYTLQDYASLECIGKKLAELDTHKVCHYLLQLMELYIKTNFPSQIIYRYISLVTKTDVKFSLTCSWLLDALVEDEVITDNLILEKIKLLNQEITMNNVELDLPHKENTLDVYSKRENRSKNESRVLPNVISSDSAIPKTVEIQHENTTNSKFQRNKLSEPELSTTSSINGKTTNNVFIDMKIFYMKLMKIGSFLLNTLISSRAAVLQMCIFKMNSLVTEGLFVPFNTFPEHIIVQISPYHASTLNSKDKVPFLICIEVIETNSHGVDMNDVKLIKSKTEDFKISLSDHSSIDFSSDTSEIVTQKIIDDNNLSENKFNTNQVSENAQFTSKRFVDAKQIRDELEKYSSKNKPKIVITKSYEEVSIQSTESIYQNSYSKTYESWSSKVDYIRKMSSYSHLQGWNVYPVIVKSGDDLRQDLLAYQLLKKCQDIWSIENAGLWIRPYEVAIISNDCGIIEAITDCISLHQLKKTTGKSLLEYFEATFGPKSGERFVNAQKNFVKSLAAYSIFQYIFRVKDRHNSNILLDPDGHIIHIDFGFMLAITPKNLSFETSPFKLTSEYIDLMGGIDSDLFVYYRALMFHGFFALQKHHDEFLYIIQILQNSKIPCIGNRKYVFDALRSRFHANLPDECFSQTIDSLILKGLKSYTTKLYDYYQYYMNGIL